MTKAISGIDEDAWEPIKYPNAIFDEEIGQWVSDAEVAEVPVLTAFVSRRKSEQVTCRLVVRRVKRYQMADPGQGTLFDEWRYHTFITNSGFSAVEADQHHRRHAIVEQVIAELKGGPLAHLPSGVFGANHAWLAYAVLVFNLCRAAAVAAGLGRARMGTVFKRIVSVPARLAKRARRLVVHLPVSWPWAAGFEALWETGTCPPIPARS